MLSHLAWNMQNGLAANRTELNVVVRDKELKELVTKYVNMIEERQVRPLLLVNALIGQLQTRHHVLLWLGGKSYMFVHRTFLEFFCARYIVHPSAADSAKLTPADVFRNHATDFSWKEVLVLVGCQLEAAPLAESLDAVVTVCRCHVNTANNTSSLCSALDLLVECLRKISRGADCPEPLKEAAVNCRALLTDVVNRMPLSGRTFSLAMTSLAELWPDEETQQLLWKLTSQEPIAGEAVEVLAKRWNTPQTRDRLTMLVTCLSHTLARASLRALGRVWRDQDTYQLIVTLVRSPYHEFTSVPATTFSNLELLETALYLLGGIWNDDPTRLLLIEVFQANCIHSRAAVELLALRWQQDKATRSTLANLLMTDESGAVAQALAQHWPDGETRTMLENAARSEHTLASRHAISALACQQSFMDDELKKTLRDVIESGGAGASTAKIWLQRGFADERAIAECINQGCCTYSITHKSYILQPSYHCRTCTPQGWRGHLGCCQTCVLSGLCAVSDERRATRQVGHARKEELYGEPFGRTNDRYVRQG